MSFYTGITLDYTQEIFRSWQLFSWSSIGLIALAGVYLRGWLRVRRFALARFPAEVAVCFLGGIAALFVALNSPLDVFSGFLLQAHMVQHLLLTMVAPPLLLLGRPYLPLLLGLPKWVTRDILAPFLQWPLLKWLGAKLTFPVIALGLFVLSNVLWHLPPLYELALRSVEWHQVEHACFFWTSILFWWPVVQPWPSRAQCPRWAIIPYLLLADLQNTALAGFLTFYDRILYPTYAVAPRLGEISALEDQAAAGVLMWVPGSLAFLVPAGVIMMRFLDGKKGVRPGAERGRLEGHESGEVKRFGLLRRLTFDLPLGVSSSLRIRRFVQWGLLTLAGVIVVDGIVGPQVSPLNLAGVLPWTHWRGFTVIALLLIGNFFCFGCPFILVRDIGRKIVQPRWLWPSGLRNKWPAVGLLVGFLFCYETFDLWDRPWVTSCVIVGYFGAILAIDLLFKQASFCKYVCPIGQFHFFGSLLSPIEVKVKEPEVCATCRTHDCLRGRNEQRGCELLLLQPRKIGNMDCTFCMDCVKACPSNNVGLSGVFPGQDLWNKEHRSSVGDFGRRTDYAALFWVLIFGAYANAAGMLVSVLALQDQVRALLPFHSKALWVSAFLLVVGGVLPALLLLPAAWISSWQLRKDGKLLSVFSVLKRFLPSLVPLGFSLWAAHFLFHFVTGFAAPLGIASRWGGSLGLGVKMAISVDWLLSLELLLIDFGVILSGYVAWRLVEDMVADSRRRVWGFLPWLFVILVLFAAAVWIIFQPMEMRGM